MKRGFLRLKMRGADNISTPVFDGECLERRYLELESLLLFPTTPRHRVIVLPL